MYPYPYTVLQEVLSMCKDLEEKGMGDLGTQAIDPALSVVGEHYMEYEDLQ